MGNVNIELPEDLHKKMKVACAANSQTLIDFVNRSLEDKMKAEKVSIR